MKTVIIGSGNLATHLSVAMKEAGMPPIQVYSPNLSHAQQLAERIGCEATNKRENVIMDADAYIISIKDDAISDVAEWLGRDRVGATLIHTAGSISIDELTRSVTHAGVLYPMQTFSKDTSLNFREIPIFVEYSDEVSKDVVMTIANAVSDRVTETDSAKRKKMHLAAVFACNMTNHCYRLAEKITEEEGIDFSLFAPLIMETARKATIMSPHDAQTGPMKRHDIGVMNMQKELIANPLTKEIYDLMAKSVWADNA
ncbi:MAG: DUF2520 domain-containing protein [Prevotella sp.]|nr:DUF2520 domain-containing protein [Prevotella sp.]